MIHRANSEALKAAFSVYPHSESSILNSISGEKEKWNQLSPPVTEKKYETVVLLIALCQQDLRQSKPLLHRIS
jgi:hypothetical protein